MRRDAFLKSIACLAAAGVLPLSARAAANVKMMIPANPGGGWDTTGVLLDGLKQIRATAARLPYIARFPYPPAESPMRPAPPGR
mgnify:CR=1 FL=1